MQVILSQAKMKDVCHPKMGNKMLGHTISSFCFLQKSLTFYPSGFYFVILYLV